MHTVTSILFRLLREEHDRRRARRTLPSTVALPPQVRADRTGQRNDTTTSTPPMRQTPNAVR